MKLAASETIPDLCIFCIYKLYINKYDQIISIKICLENMRYILILWHRLYLQQLEFLEIKEAFLIDSLDSYTHTYCTYS